MEQMRPKQLAEWLSDSNRAKPVLLDVRQPWEFAMCNLPGSLHIPMHMVPLRSSELKRDDPIVVICHHGHRSNQVARYLEQQGYTKVINLAGGVAAWSDEVDPNLPRY